MVPVVNSTCVVPATVRGAENAMGGAYRSGPGALLLPATDGSNCAETHVSQALIMYAVCCMLLSRVPCGSVSAYIFGTSGAREWGEVGGGVGGADAALSRAQKHWQCLSAARPTL